MYLLVPSALMIANNGVDENENGLEDKITPVGKFTKLGESKEHSRALNEYVKIP